MDHRSKYEIQNLKFLEKIGENLCDVGFGDELLDTTPKAGPVKLKTNK